jgi:hypothetical protein
LLPKNKIAAQLSLAYILNNRETLAPSFGKIVDYFLKSETNNRKLFYNMLVNEVLNKEYLQKYIQPMFLKHKGNLKFIHGEKDKLISVEGIKRLAKDLESELFIIKNSGHSPIYENPEIINEYLINHFNKLK